MTGESEEFTVLHGTIKKEEGNQEMREERGRRTIER